MSFYVKKPERKTLLPRNTDYIVASLGLILGILVLLAQPFFNRDQDAAALAAGSKNNTMYQISATEEQPLTVNQFLSSGQLTKSIFQMAGNVVKDINNYISRAIEVTGNIASRTRCSIDEPVAILAEKILHISPVTKISGVEYFQKIEQDATQVNVYVVSRDGLIGRFMDMVIKLTGGTGAAGGSLYPIGIFVEQEYFSSSYSPEIELHEFCHYYQQSIFGFGPWLVLYTGEILSRDILAGDISEGYKDCSWELAANLWASQTVSSITYTS